jgi:hypothetical protein
VIRLAGADDWTAILEVHRAAFDGDDVPRLAGRFGFVRADEVGLEPPPEALYDWAFQVAVLDEAAALPRGRVAYSEPFRH